MECFYSQASSNFQLLCLNETKNFCDAGDKLEFEKATEELYLTKLFYVGEFLMMKTSFFVSAQPIL